MRIIYISRIRLYENNITINGFLKWVHLSGHFFDACNSKRN